MTVKTTKRNYKLNNYVPLTDRATPRPFTYMSNVLVAGLFTLWFSGGHSIPQEKSSVVKSWQCAKKAFTLEPDVFVQYDYWTYNLLIVGLLLMASSVIAWKTRDVRYDNRYFHDLEVFSIRDLVTQGSFPFRLITLFTPEAFLNDFVSAVWNAWSHPMAVPFTLGVFSCSGAFRIGLGVFTVGLIRAIVQARIRASKPELPTWNEIIVENDNFIIADPSFRWKYELLTKILYYLNEYLKNLNY